MKLKLASILVLLVGVIWFVSFLMSVNDTPVDHGRIISSATHNTMECRGWSVGMWSNSKCENVVTEYTRYEDSHTTSIEVSRVSID